MEKCCGEFLEKYAYILLSSDEDLLQSTDPSDQQIMRWGK
jgi:hypothetical protein